MAQDYRAEQLVKNNIESERGLPPTLECKITVRASKQLGPTVN